MADPKAAKPAASAQEGDFPLPDLAAFARNLVEVGKKSQQLVVDYFSRRESKPGVGVVELGNVARFEEAQGPGTIERFARQRQVVVSARRRTLSGAWR